MDDHDIQELGSDGQAIQTLPSSRKNLRPDIAKGDVEEMNVPKEPDKIVQMVFWEPVKYVKRRKKTPS